jgi:hypothetical protein
VTSLPLNPPLLGDQVGEGETIFLSESDEAPLKRPMYCTFSYLRCTLWENRRVSPDFKDTENV